MNKAVEDGIAKAISEPRPEVQKITDEMVDFIKRKEGFRERSYLCPAGVWTIGYGSTRYPDRFPVIEGEACTEKQAEEFLREELDILEYQLNDFLLKNRIVLDKFQFSALISFAYNVGIGRVIRRGSVYKALLENDLPYVTRGMKKYCKITKRKLGIPYKVKVPGLVKRRADEAYYFWIGNFHESH